MTKNGNILFVIDKLFPYGEAFSSRARNIVKLFKLCGYNSIIIARRNNENDKEFEENNDYICYRVNDPKSIFTLSGIGTEKPYMERIRYCINNYKIDFILSCNLPFVIEHIYKLAQKHNIPYIIEQCEWFDASSFKFKYLNPYYLENMRMIKRKISKLDGVIAISNFLEKHYKSQGLQVLKIPAITDISEIKFRTECDNNKKINLIFAGSLGKGKENLKPLFEAIDELKDEIAVHVSIYGPNEEQVKKNIDNDIELFKSIENFVTIYGRIPQIEVEEKIRNADYAIIIRPKRKSSNAGFPTKLVESLSVGTPVIANKTGDIENYIITEKNGYIANNKDELKNILKKICLLSLKERANMRMQARLTAENSFDYKLFVKETNAFINKIQKKEVKDGKRKI